MQTLERNIWQMKKLTERYLECDTEPKHFTFSKDRSFYRNIIIQPTSEEVSIYEMIMWSNEGS